MLRSQGNQVRHPWPRDFPKVLVHARWREEGLGKKLNDHEAYDQAKFEANARAAVHLLNDCLKHTFLDLLVQHCDRVCDDQVTVVAPSVGPPNAKNAISLGYAKYLSEVMEWRLCRDIYQQPTVKRDRKGSRWFRLVHEPAFYGSVEPGRSYVIADDVVTAGGTMASLKGFIEGHGSYVVAMTAVASLDGYPTRVALQPDTLSVLQRQFGGAIPAMVRKEFGYDVACLTQSEAEFLAGCRSVGGFDAGVLGGRNPEAAGSA